MVQRHRRTGGVEDPDSVPHNARDTHGDGALGYFRFNVDVQKEDKLRVAEYVCRELVKDGDSIVLDAGSSAMYVGEVLFKRYRRKNVSILTHNMEVFERFWPGYKQQVEPSHGMNIQLALTGGEFSASYNALFGIQTESAFKEYFPRLTILAVSGLICSKDPEYVSGLYCHATAEQSVKKLLFTKATDRRIVVADWTKLGRPDSFMFGEINKLSQGVAEGVTIVTTEPPRSENEKTKKRFGDTISELRNLLGPEKVKCLPAT